MHKNAQKCTHMHNYAQQAPSQSTTNAYCLCAEVECVERVHVAAIGHIHAMWPRSQWRVHDTGLFAFVVFRRVCPCSRVLLRGIHPLLFGSEGVRMFWIHIIAV